MNSKFGKSFGLLAAAAIVGAMAMSSNPAYAAGEKCYGVAKAGKNDCKTDLHSCAGQTKMESDPASFIELPAGTCEKLTGGSLAPKKK